MYSETVRFRLPSSYSEIKGNLHVFGNDAALNKAFLLKSWMKTMRFLQQGHIREIIDILANSKCVFLFTDVTALSMLD
jgi:hypothetical protein